MVKFLPCGVLYNRRKEFVDRRKCACRSERNLCRNEVFYRIFRKEFAFYLFLDIFFLFHSEFSMKAKHSRNGFIEIRNSKQGIGLLCRFGDIRRRYRRLQNTFSLNGHVVA